MQSQNISGLSEVLAENKNMVDESFDPTEFVANPRNVLLEEDGSFGIFEYEAPGVYTGHYMFKARGEDAVRIADKMINEVFMRHGAKIIGGCTPVFHKGAQKLCERLGLKSYGVVDTYVGPATLNMVRLDEFYAQRDKSK